MSEEQSYNYQRIKEDAQQAYTNSPYQNTNTLTHQNKEIKFDQKINGQDEGDMREETEIEQASIISMSSFLFKHSKDDLIKHKFHYCLAFFSVFTVVIFTIAINAIVEQGPIIFLIVAEGNQGAIDGTVKPVDSFYNEYNDKGDITYQGQVFLNYTQILNLYGQDQYNLSPRKSFCGVNMGIMEDNQATNQSIHMSSSKTICYQLISTEREGMIGLNKYYPFESLASGECILNWQNTYFYEDQKNIEIGDVVYNEIDISNTMNEIIKKYNQQYNDEVPFMIQNTDAIIFPCTVKHIGVGTYSKFSIWIEEEVNIIELDTFLPYIANYLPAHIQSHSDFIEYLKNANRIQLNEFVDKLVMTLPEPRTKYYKNPNYDEIERQVTDYTTELSQQLGYYSVTIQLDLLDEVKMLSYAILFMDLIFNIIIILFVSISILLIYSLLTISIEQKSFEIGVMRMVGLSKTGLIIMIVLQSFMFVLPSIFFGFILSYPLLNAIGSSLKLANLEIDSLSPTQMGIIQALIVGVVIPIAASILPIQSALTKNLNDSLDYQRSKTQAIYVNLLKKDDVDLTSYIIFGILCIGYGLGVYYFLPLAMLQLNLPLILQLFFIILIGMLLGLTLLSLNLQRVLEIAFTYIFLFYEKKSMKELVLKNLISHKMRNRMTTIIFSLAIGFIIFLVVSYNMQMDTAVLNQQRKYGGSYIIYSLNNTFLKPSQIEPIINEFIEDIDSFSYSTLPLTLINTSNTVQSELSDRSRSTTRVVDVYGVSPNIFDSTLSQFLIYDYFNSTSNLTGGEQLYTARGSQGIGIGQEILISSGINPSNNYKELIILNLQQSDNSKLYYQMRTTFSCKKAPGFELPERGSTSSKQSLLASIPMLLAYSNQNSLENGPYERLFIKFKNEQDKNLTQSFTTKLRSAMNSVQNQQIKIYNSLDSQDANQKVRDILNVVFNVIIAITMFLCFFSLSSSMSANIYEQCKEIGMLRAVGLQKNRIMLMFIYEAFILVISSAIMGVIIGTMIGYTMTMQQSLYTQIPITFYFPIEQFTIVMAISILCSFASTYGPAKQLISLEIAQLFRRN